MSFWQAASVSTATATHRDMTRTAGRPQVQTAPMTAGSRAARVIRLWRRTVRPQCQYGGALMASKTED